MEGSHPVSCRDPPWKTATATPAHQEPGGKKLVTSPGVGTAGRRPAPWPARGWGCGGPDDAAAPRARIGGEKATSESARRCRPPAGESQVGAREASAAPPTMGASALGCRAALPLVPGCDTPEPAGAPGGRREGRGPGARLMKPAPDPARLGAPFTPRGQSVRPSVHRSPARILPPAAARSESEAPRQSPPETSWLPGPSNSREKVISPHILFQT
ncbi:Hypothetical predicted protein [Marmota monax]|uniref:Uncharacterized protein n=1 Tax=Marmota monax TaxID=9995 RepID=A0A5E4BD70_MARMO|nr:Hypothetical predicted protein [Marmota monax]